MMDLADRRVLAQEHAVTTAKLGDVADEHDSSTDLVVFEQREASHEHHDLGQLLELLGRRCAGLEREAHGVVVDAELAEPHADRVPLHADAMER